MLGEKPRLDCSTTAMIQGELKLSSPLLGYGEQNDNRMDVKKGSESETGERTEEHKGIKPMKEQKNRVEGAVLTNRWEERKGVNGDQIEK
jgi:hypothetical protein